MDRGATWYVDCCIGKLTPRNRGDALPSAARTLAPESRQLLESSCFSSISFGTLVAVRTGGPTKWHATCPGRSGTSARRAPSVTVFHD
jgi:hypothetical protein